MYYYATIEEKHPEYGWRVHGDALVFAYSETEVRQKGFQLASMNVWPARVSAVRLASSRPQGLTG